MAKKDKKQQGPSEFGRSIGGPFGQYKTPEPFAPPVDLSGIANVNNLYKQAINNQMRQTTGGINFSPRQLQKLQEFNRARQTFGGGGASLNQMTGRYGGSPDQLDLSGMGGKRNVSVDAILQLGRQRKNAPNKVANLQNYAEAQGYQGDDVTNTLQNYLAQDVAFQKFAPNQYRIPGKMDLLNAVIQSAPDPAAQAQNDQILQYVEAMRQLSMLDADNQYNAAMDKASTIKDPDKQAMVVGAIDALRNLRALQSSSEAANAFGMGGGENSIASILAAYQAGNNKNINALYGGAGNVPSTSGAQAYDDEFLAQLLAGE